ncbi:MAG TPA: DPP IV N-terminal domain-containing protein [Rhodothermales bacterium]|nr:DPP IV N-terminal domain-containing protein [Rhodothermales bacterium]
MYYTVFEGDNLQTYSLDLGSGTAEPLFDTQRLREALSDVLGYELKGSGTPFRRFRLIDGSDRLIGFSLDDRSWLLDLDTYEVHPGTEPETNPRRIARRGKPGRSDLLEARSPDGRFAATLEDGHAAIRDVSNESTKVIASASGYNDFWGYTGILRRNWAWWSPDGGRLVVRHVDMTDVDSVAMIEWLHEPPRVEWIRSVHNVREGQALPKESLHSWSRETDRLTRLDTGDQRDAFLRVLGWRQDGSELIVLRITRDYRDLQILGLDPDTGERRTILAEHYSTCFDEPVWAASTLRYWPLSDNKRFIWKSSNQGNWNHLFLQDYDTGRSVQLTSGAFEVQDVVGIDEVGRWVYFRARSDPMRPYDIHLHRVRLDGSGFAKLTSEPGRYAAELVADARFLEVWRRRIDAPTELQLMSGDGKLVHTVSTADMSAAAEAGWKSPESFSVKAADDSTDLWGVLYKPSDFDPNRKYPVVEFIYGGPILEYVPHGRPYGILPHALAQLGFIVVQVDARGTPNRGRAFLEAGYDRPSVVIADHAAAIRQLGKRHSYIDLDKVGVVGQSWGAIYTVRALLNAPSLYSVGIAVSGGWWSSLEYGAAKATVFEACAALRKDEPPPSLKDLHGHLLLIHGTADVNLSGSADLMRWLDSVIEAGKYVDLVILPDRPHSILGRNSYVWGAVSRYFVEHLNGPFGGLKNVGVSTDADSPY